MQHSFRFRGLSDDEVLDSRKRHGSNTGSTSGNTVWPILREIVTEPMFLLLLAAGVVYLLLGERDEAFFMIAAIGAVSAISFFQAHRSRKALDMLRAYTRAMAAVLRNGEVRRIPTEDIVVGDFVVVEEGSLIPADGVVMQSNDFTVNESILTGESFTVAREAGDPANSKVYQGTIVSSGLALVEVTAIGTDTHLGKIGESLADIAVEKTPLQLQIHSFVRRMALAGIAVFLLIWVYNFILSRDVLDSLLKGLTLAMSILPEEIPVAFTTFMALGAWRLMQHGIVVKHVRTVETLGAANVLCIDKTGTITENRMELRKIYAHASGVTASGGAWDSAEIKRVIELAMWASEPAPFDPMEKALHAAYAASGLHDDRPDAVMIHEYPLSGKPPIMTHIFRTRSGRNIVAAKGAPETILRLSRLEPDEKEKLNHLWRTMSLEGYRVLGVAEGIESERPFPEDQENISFAFVGLIAFYDPPKKNIGEVVANFYKAGLSVKMITGDNENTASSVARHIGLKNAGRTIDGQAVLAMTDDALSAAVTNSNIFARMFPEAKLRVINALKNAGQIVAMTGDGVNDGPALKAAHIGIAMGKRGTELAKMASSMVLVEDDLSKMVDALMMGRKIYGNLKKAIQYIISIHIPIILTVSLPLFLGWIYPDIFTPVHVIFLELIMGPTCSIVYENEPPEPNIMEQPPRDVSANFLSWHDLRTSIVQGLFITAGTLGCYQVAIAEGLDEESTRSMVFVALIVANVFLTLANRSFYDSILTVLRYKNNLMKGIIALTLLLLFLIVYTPQLNSFFQLQPLSATQLALASLIGFLSVVWFEGYKAWQRMTARRRKGTT